MWSTIDKSLYEEDLVKPSIPLLCSQSGQKVYEQGFAAAHSAQLIHLYP